MLDKLGPDWLKNLLKKNILIVSQKYFKFFKKISTVFQKYFDRFSLIFQVFNKIIFKVPVVHDLSAPHVSLLSEVLRLGRHVSRQR